MSASIATTVPFASNVLCETISDTSSRPKAEGRNETVETTDGQIRARAGHEPAEHIGTGAIGAEPVLA